MAYESYLAPLAGLLQLPSAETGVVRESRGAAAQRAHGRLAFSARVPEAYPAAAGLFVLSIVDLGAQALLLVLATKGLEVVTLLAMRWGSGLGMQHCEAIV